MSSSLAIAFSILICVSTADDGFNKEYKENNLPDFNFCIYSLHPLTVITDCFLDELPKDFSEEFRQTVTDVFGGLPFAECLKMVCKNNNDDGYMLLKTWLEEIDENDRKNALLSAWTCIERHEELLRKDVSS